MTIIFGIYKKNLNIWQLILMILELVILLVGMKAYNI
jgi:hypothetical protein